MDGALREKTGGQVLAIPHNSKLSNGLMFAKTDFKGNDIDANYTKKKSEMGTSCRSDPN